jgi:hypothetical protein
MTKQLVIIFCLQRLSDQGQDLIGGIIAGVIVAIISLIFEYTLFASKPRDTQNTPRSSYPPTVITIPMVQFVTPNKVECEYCHAKNNPDPAQGFCTNCGKNLYEKCLKCSQKNPLNEPYCGKCGQKRSELKQIRDLVSEIYVKAIIIGACILVIMFRAVTLSTKSVNWIDILSIPVIFAGLYGLGKEAFEDTLWIFRSKVWRDRNKWDKVSIQKIIRSSYINLAISVIFPLLMGYGVFICFGWILNK